MTVAVHRPDRRIAQQLDVARLLDAPDQIAGHVLIQVVAANQKQHLAGVLGEEDCGLAGRIATAHDHHQRSLAQLRLVRRRGIVDARTLEPFAPLDAQPAVVGARGDQQALGGNVLAAIQVDDVVAALEFQAADRSGNDGQAGAELVGLQDGAAGQLGTCHAGGKSKVVLDAHAAAGLSPGSGALEHRRPQSFGRSINRGRESRGAGPYHEQVVHGVLERLVNADRVGQLPVRRVAQKEPVAAGDHRRVGFGDAKLLEQVVHLRVGFDVHPGEQSAILGEEVADPECVGGVARADHAQSRKIRRLAQKLPPGDERLEDNIAERGALVQRAPQGVPRDFVHFAIASSHGADDGRKAGEVRNVAGELAFAMNRDRLWLLARVVDDLDLAQLDDEEFEVAVADRKQRLPIPVHLGSGGRAMSQLGDLGLVKGREGDGLETMLDCGSATQ